MRTLRAPSKSAHFRRPELTRSCVRSPRGDPRIALATAAICRCKASSPSNSAAGPGCRMIGDLISCSWPLRTAGIACQPGRAATRSGRNFLPHHEPRIRSGWRRTISRAVGDDAIAGQRFLRQFGEHVVAAGDADQLGDPADAADRRLVPFLEVDARAATAMRAAAASTAAMWASASPA